MNLNSIRKILFTNILAEKVFILFLKANILPNIINKFIPGNILYKKNIKRKVKRNGIIYRLDISDYQAWLLYFLSNQDDSREVIKYLGDAKVIIDVGANIGQSCLEINKNRIKYQNDFKVICFEPYPDNHANLIANLNLNNNTHNIKVESWGLGDNEQKN